MSEPSADKDDDIITEDESCNIAAIRNTILFSIAAIAVGSAIYYVIKENRKLRQEKERLEYEIWG